MSFDGSLWSHHMVHPACRPASGLLIELGSYWTMLLSLPETITMNQRGHQAWWDICFKQWGRRACLKKAKQGASPPPTHVRAKETALRRQEKKFSLFFPLFVFSSEWFIVMNHGGLNINLFSLRITDLARKYYIIDRCLSSNSQVMCCIHKETEQKEVSNTDNVGISESKGI